jgi:RimJ/RimL family protein N-acetyltransferase
MSAAFIGTDRIVLCTLDKKSHLDVCHKWFNDQDVIRYLLSDCFPTTYEQEAQWFEKTQSNDQVMFAIETKEQRKYIGNIGLHHIDWINRTARTVTIIGEKEEWGKGFGTEAKMVIIRYAFNALNLRKLSSHVIEDNLRSIKMNVRCGFSEEGRLREQLYRQGKYSDLFIFGLMRRKWHEEEALHDSKR